MSKRKKTPDKLEAQAKSASSLPSALRFSIPIGVLIIVLAAFFVYFPSLSGGYIWDDDRYLTNCPLIKSPDGLYRFWFSSEPLDYYPVSNTTLWIEWRLWGISPAGYHVTNLILHIASALLVWIILKKLSIPGAFLAAVIFAVHPVNVESVAWISQRKHVLAMLFFLLSILCYLKFIARARAELAAKETPLATLAPSPWSLAPAIWYFVSLAMFLLAMLSKGSVPMLPVVLLGIIWLHRPLTRRDFIQIVPFFVVAVVLTGVHVWFQTHGSGEAFRTAGFAERLLGAGGVVWFYLYKAIMPCDLTHVYPQWKIQTDNLLWWLPLFSGLAITVVFWIYRESWSRPFLFAWGFFCISLAPVMGFTDTGYMQSSLVADHYQYVAIIGVIVLAAAGWGRWHIAAPGIARLCVAGTALAICGALMFLAWRQSALYGNPVMLYQSSLEKNPDSYIVLNCLGSTLSNTGREQEAVKYFEQSLLLKSDFYYARNNLGIALNKLGRKQEAIETFRQVLRLKPDFHDAYYNLGMVLEQTGQLQNAMECFRQVLALKPDHPDAHNSLGIILIKLGRPQEAVDHLQMAIRINPDFPQAQNNLGNALSQMGRQQEAIECYKQALLTNLDVPDFHYNLGNSYKAIGQYQQAIEQYEQALALKSDYFDAHNNLAILLAQINRLQEAIEHFQLALKLKTDDPDIHYNMGNALAQTGRLQEAIKHYELSLRFNPNFSEAYNNLGGIFFNMGRTKEAIDCFNQAIRIKPDYAHAWNNLALAYAGLSQSSEAMAAAKKALALARSQGQAGLAKQIEEWINTYQSQEKTSRELMKQFAIS